LVVRDANSAAEVEAACDLWSRAEAAETGTTCSDEQLRQFIDEMRDAAAKPGARLFVGLMDDELVATIYGIPLRTDATKAQVAMLAVEPARWGAGIGSEMLTALIGALDGAGCRHLRMNVEPANARARALYERHGWRQCGETEQVDDSDAPELIYRIDLTKADIPQEPVLRSWQAADAPALRDAWLSSPDLGTQFGDADLSTDEHARDFIAQVLVSEDTRQNWAIVAGGVAVGNVGASAIEYRHETAWISYWLAWSARGRGYATRALTTVADWAFDAGLFRLELGHRLNNPASCGVATRAGFITEGTERQKLKYASERFDVELHARLATDPAPVTNSLHIVH
jgi:RimJ/RimL family protein N-acetyltransferase